MTRILNQELSDALRNAGGPLEVQDPADARSYVIVPKDEYQMLLSHDFEAWLKVGIDHADRGEVKEWNLDEFLADARRRTQRG